MTKPATVNQADLTRAIRAARNGGVEVAKIELEPSGKIVIFAGNGQSPPAANEWDEDLR